MDTEVVANLHRLRDHEENLENRSRNTYDQPSIRGTYVIGEIILVIIAETVMSIILLRPLKMKLFNSMNVRQTVLKIL